MVNNNKFIADEIISIVNEYEVMLASDEDPEEIK